MPTITAANPAGTALSPADYARLRQLADAHDLWLVVDEVYGDYVASALRPPPAGFLPKKVKVLTDLLIERFGTTRLWEGCPR